MILAAPLVIPFAEAVGISVASIGMAKAADMVNDYIQENPEQSVKILSAIVPNVGIGQIFANKEKISLEDLDEMSDEEAADLPTDIKADLMKQGGKSQGSGKRELMKELSRKIGLSGRGKEKKDMEYEADERYEGGVEEKADGGAIGIEVLFGEKKPRKNFFMGGPALEGPALGIYNSMKAYQSFTDQEIADAIKQAGYSLPTADSGTTTPPDSTPGSSQPSGNNDGRSAPPVGSVLGGSGLIGDYMTAIEGRQDRLTNPNVPTSFISSLTGGGQRDIGEMIRSGEVDTRKSSGIPLGIGSAIARMMPDKYYDMSLADQVFTQSQMGYTGPTVFGENSMGNKDPFGLNVRSGFGNYAEAVGSNFNQLRDTLTKDRAGVTFNEETGLFEGVNADVVNKQTEMIRNKYNFRKQQLGVKNVLDSKIKAADTQREKERLAAEVKAKAEAVAKQKIADTIKAEEAAKKQKAIEKAAKDKRDAQQRIKDAEKRAAIEKAAKDRRDAQQTIKDAEKRAAQEKAAKVRRDAQQKIRDAEKRESARKANEAATRKAAADLARRQEEARRRGGGGGGNGGGQGDRSGGRSSGSGESDYGGFCFDPRTLIQMADGSTKQIKNIQLGDATKGGEVTGVFQFKAADEIHDYKGVTVAGSHYVKEDGKFIMVKDSPLSVKIDKIPVVYSLDTTGRRIFINRY